MSVHIMIFLGALYSDNFTFFFFAFFYQDASRASGQGNTAVDKCSLDCPMSGKVTTGFKIDGGSSLSPIGVNTERPPKASSAFEFSPEYRAWRDRNTVAGIKYYGRYGVYDGARLSKLVDFLDACKVPILTLSFLCVAGLVIGSLSMIGIGALGLLLFTLAYLLVLLLRPPV